MEEDHLRNSDKKSTSLNVGFFYLRLLGNDLNKLLCLRSDRVYTIGRNPKHCKIVIDSPAISRRHCQILLSRSDCKLRLIDGSFESPRCDPSRIGSKCKVCRVSSNGVFVNGRRLPRGVVAELNVGDLILLCVKKKYGFVVEKIVFSKVNQNVLSDTTVSLRAESLLGQLRSIVSSHDPVSYLRTLRNVDSTIRSADSEKPLNKDVADKDEISNPSSNREPDVGCRSDGKTFFLNRLTCIDHGVPDQSMGVTLPQLLHPVVTLTQIFIATFTCDVSWFLDYCEIPNQLPITIACHNKERCWSASQDSRTAVPFSSYPNLLLVYPRFPDEIAFGKDRKKHGVACHHPKLIILHRRDTMRIVITSANLVSRQWDHITNTVWWQDFPSRKIANYSSLFGPTEEDKADFGAHLAGFIASLINDIPSQAHWIDLLAKYDFGEATCHLIASVPGVYAQNPSYLKSNYSLCAKQVLNMNSRPGNYLGCVHTSVVGLSHRFGASVDSNGGQFKMLATILGRCRENSSGTVEVILKRNMHIPADANAVSVIIKDKVGNSDGDSILLGFLPKEIAKWVSPLSDSALLSFSAFIYPKETLEAAYAGANTRVQLLLYLSKGPNFDRMTELIHEGLLLASLCSLLALLKRSFGLWRLQEVLSQHKWPESLETEFIYGSSSVGTSVSPDFLAAFSTAAGKKSYNYSDSQESDPEWGRWRAEHELRKPSIKFLFPTIDRVRSGVCGGLLSRYLLCLSEKTWQRLRPMGLFHDAIPYPSHRIGYPMHVKVACRRFQSRADGNSFGWIYCGSHNFSPAAWGQTLHPSPSPLGPKLHICNYELGIVFLYPEHSSSGEARINIDNVKLPFVTPAPKFKPEDRPATPQAMREVFAEAQSLVADLMEEMNEVSEVDDDEDEQIIEVSEEGDEERIYAEMLLGQIDADFGVVDDSDEFKVTGVLILVLLMTVM
ncbi:forkhead-associated domain-containing protein / FHA domain-containing protein [Rhynchospora pubera]|uniref:Forkhead-associated domain-containing protein / FHA domain-containing protein n=1 Tax=Rhynchospora pubera TaxID=906938 RepID=A0AAV8D5J8_9POAL|nr:forkhead-associated domain-containing protein / FHA domain-containing protein [Rhynchospora pubera]